MLALLKVRRKTANAERGGTQRHRWVFSRKKKKVKGATRR